MVKARIKDLVGYFEYIKEKRWSFATRKIETL